MEYVELERRLLPEAMGLFLQMAEAHLASDSDDRVFFLSTGMGGPTRLTGPRGTARSRASGRVSDRALVVDGTVEARPAFEMSLSMDHRFVDGWHIGRLATVVRDYFKDPMAHENPAE